jgi:hypothetical protein
MSSQAPVTEEQLRQMFDQNFERLRLENGHSLAPDVREAAWEQVRLYWRKLRAVAESVTDTEVKLNLPAQRTPKGRIFCLEGVVDIVREADKVTMYDLKTHDLAFVRSNLALYRDQLNVYAHIWRNLRGEHLDETAVIATPVPNSVTEAMRTRDPERIEAALADWEPIVRIEFDPENVKSTIAEFAKAVDEIEDQKFRPPSVNALTNRQENQGTFAVRVCRNCDLRFSCSSYREYARRHKDRNWRKFADFYDLEGDQVDELIRFTAAVPDGMSVAEAEA